MSSSNSKKADIEKTWSDLPAELVRSIDDRLSNNIELRCFRGICKPWRTALASKEHYPNRFRSKLCNFDLVRMCRYFPSILFRVTVPSSCSSKGWLIRTRQLYTSTKNNLLSPLSLQVINSPADKSIDLLKFAVSEISQSYEIEGLASTRVVCLDNMFFALSRKKIIWCAKKGEERNGWTRLKREGENQVDDVTDIIIHKGHVYALDLSGGIWWISLSTLRSDQYAPSTPLENDEVDSLKEKRLVEFCGDLYVVHRFCKKFRVERGDKYIERTTDFKVFKMDENLAIWITVSSLGDRTIIMAVDTCFTVVASEYYGCLDNSIYFTDTVEDKFSTRRATVKDVKVFKLDDGSIIDMSDSSHCQSCFQMFTPPFL